MPISALCTLETYNPDFPSRIPEPSLLMEFAESTIGFVTAGKEALAPVYLTNVVFISAFLPPNGHIVDFGCGGGNF